MSSTVDDSLKDRHGLQKLKGSSNWPYWSNAFMRLMKLKKLSKLFSSDWESQYGVTTLDTITGAQIHHGVTGKTEDDINLAMYLLTLHIDPDLLHIIDAVECPFDAWSSLQKNFASAGISGEFTVVRRMNELRFSENDDEDVNTRLQKFLGQRSEIVSAGLSVGLNFAKLSEAQCIRIEIVNILIRLPDDIFSNFIDGAARRLSSYRSVNECIDELRIWAQTRVELRRSNQQVEASAASRSSSPSVKVCTHCKKRGHVEKDCFDLYPEKKAEMEARRAKRTQAKKETAEASAAETPAPPPTSGSNRHENDFPADHIFCALAEICPVEVCPVQTPFSDSQRADTVLSGLSCPILYDVGSSLYPVQVDGCLEFDFRTVDAVLSELRMNAIFSELSSPIFSVAEIPKDSPLDGPEHPEFNLAAQRQVFLMDSAASRHLTNIKEALFRYRPHRVPVSLANKSTVYTEGLGELHVRITFPGTNLTHLVKFTNVLYAPWARNLLSIGQLTVERNFTCTIIQDIMTLHMKNEPVFRAKSVSNNVFQLEYNHLYTSGEQWDPSNEIIVAPVTTPENLAIVLHMSLGHPSFDVMKKMITSAKFPLSVSDLRQAETSIRNCKACAFGKLSRQPFPKKVFDHPRAEKPFSLIHTDLKITNIGTRPYLLMVIDDMSQYMWGFFMSRKNETMKCIEWLVNRIKTQHGYSLIRWRSDNGGEFVNSQEKQLLAKLGIIHETSVPFTPQQNGVAERANRTVGDKVIAALMCAKLPKMGFWKSAVSWVLFNINRTVTSSNVITPFERFTGQAPVYNGIHPFGCYAIVHSEHTTAFDARATACLFMGYCTDTKGYKLYEIESKRHFVSRNVKFYDDEFPGLGGEYKSSDALDTAEVIIDIDNDGPFDDESSHSHHDTSPPGERFVELQENSPPSLPTSPLSEVPAAPLPIIPAPLPIIQPSTPVLRDPLDPVPEVPLSIRRSTRETRAPDRFVGGHSVQRNFAALADLEQLEHSDTLMSVLEEIYACHVEADIDFEIDPTEPQELEACLAKAEGDDDWPENLTMENMPKTYEEAIKSPHAKYFKRAMAEAIAVFSAKEAYDVVRLPEGKASAVLRGRWVFTVKLNSDNKVIAIKARWVVKGYLQKDVDYGDVFAPTAKAATVRLFFALVTHHNWHVEQGDINSAFLTAGLHTGDEVFMEQPHGFVRYSTNHVAFLRKAMWGLRKSPVYFYDSVSGKLIVIGFQKVEGEECMFFRIIDEQIVLLVLYVDDFLLGGPKPLVISAMKDIGSMPEIKIDHRGSLESGPLHMLGVSIEKEGATISFNQRLYVERMLRQFDPNDKIKPCSTPSTRAKIDAWAAERVNPVHSVVDPIEYLTAIGPMIWLSCNARPDISFTVGQLARYSAHPTELHWNGVTSLIGYLKGTKNFRLIMKRQLNALPIMAYGDASHSTDDTTRRSTSGAIIQVHGNTVMWSSKRQASVTTSTLEAEFVAFGHVLKSCLWLVKLIDQVGPKIPRPIRIFCDNQATVRAVMSESSRSEKLRHVDISLKFIRELCDRKVFEVTWIPNATMAADIFTKPLEKSMHLACCKLINICWT